MINNSDINKYNDHTRILIQEKNVCLYVFPHTSLRSYISNYTITFPKHANDISENYTVLPHASATLVIEIEADNTYINLYGPATIPDIVGTDALTKEFLLIIEFQPAGLFALTGITQAELTDKGFLLDMVDPILDRQLREMVEKNETIHTLIADLDKVFHQTFKYPYPPQMRTAIHEIIKYSGVLPIKQVSEKLHYSERQMGRLFNQHVGVSPKLFSRIVRVNYSLRLLRNTTKNIETIAGLTGYHDPSHFLRDFKLVCGITPQEFRLKMSDFYNEINKF